MKYYGSIPEIENYESPYFSFKYVPDCFWNTCGSASLSLITGISPRIIEKSKPKSSKHWSDRAIKNYLNKKGYKIFEISIEGITNTDWENFPLNNKHVLLINAIVDREEASWFVAHGGKIYHNQYEMEEGKSNLFFLNKPTQSVFLVWHEKWA